MVTSNNILYAWAKDGTGVIHEAATAPRELEFFCIECGQEMVLARGSSGRVRPHFRHKANVENCSPETVLHRMAKTRLYERLTQALQTGRPIDIEWRCISCGEDHSQELTEGASKVALEVSMGPTRPDILIYGQDQKPLWAIEIVVTHEPEPHALDYYRQNAIRMVQFDVKTIDSLELMERGALKPSRLEYCIYPTCCKCGGFMFPVRIRNVTSNCWKCRKPMTVSLVLTPHGWFGPEEYTQQMVDLANQNGANIQNRYSKTIRETYWANTCKHCNSIVGQFYIHDYIYEEPYAVIDAGYRCECAEDEAVDEEE